MQHKHRDRGHFFQFNFQPALPALNSLNDWQGFPYELSLDDKTRLLSGELEISKGEEVGNVVLKWHHLFPDWSRDHQFNSLLIPLSVQPKGHILAVKPELIQFKPVA